MALNERLQMYGNTLIIRSRCFESIARVRRRALFRFIKIHICLDITTLVYFFLEEDLCQVSKNARLGTEKKLISIAVRREIVIGVVEWLFQGALIARSLNSAFRVPRALF
jgi:hypothetical protein